MRTANRNDITSMQGNVVLNRPSSTRRSSKHSLRSTANAIGQRGAISSPKSTVTRTAKDKDRSKDTCKRTRSRRRTRTRTRRKQHSSSSRKNMNKKLSMSDPSSIKVELFQESKPLSWKNLSTACCRGHIQSDADCADDSFKMDNDPLGDIIEQARHAVSSQRVPVVTFDLRKNQVIHPSSTSSSESSPSRSGNSSPRRKSKWSPLRLSMMGNKQKGKSNKKKVVSCLRNATATSNSNTSAINTSGLVKSVLFDGNYLEDSERSIKEKENEEPIAMGTGDSNTNKNGTDGNDPATNSSETDTSSHPNSNSKLDAQIKHSIARGKNLKRTFYYHLATQRFLEVLSVLDKHAQIYDDRHPLRVETVQLIQDIHHAQKSMEHSANIVKMGLRHETQNEYMKALKMYSVAFRIRRNMLGPKHPSLPILLNLLGSIQVKRKEMEEAMNIFEVALYGKLRDNCIKKLGDNSERDLGDTPPLNKYAMPGTLAVSMKEMGGIYEQWGRLDEALDMYHNSLDSMVQYAKKDFNFVSNPSGEDCSVTSEDTTSTSPESLLDVCVVNATTSPSSSPLTISTSSSSWSSLEPQAPPEEMEIYLQESFESDLDFWNDTHRSISNLASYYDSFFRNPDLKSTLIDKKKVSLHVTTTLHHIANVHRKQKDYVLSIACYNAALRGMKLIQGEKHPNVAAILGNLGNLLKDMKDYDQAYSTYQTVLKIESIRLGFSNPDVMITMLNIALIELCRGKYEDSIRLYKEVIKIQRRKRDKGGDNTNLLAVSYSCLGDAQEKKGDIGAAIQSYEEALNLRTTSLAEFHPDLGKLLHKLGRMCSLNGELHRAEKMFVRALRLYKHNKLDAGDPRVVEVQRDRADNRVKIALMERNQEGTN